MTTNPATTPNADVATTPPAKPAPPASPARLLILLGLLAVVIGAYAYDYLVARPGVNAANDKIQAFVDTQNKRGVKDGSQVTPETIHKELGMTPTSRMVNEKDDYEVEYYRWWGHVPLLNTRRHYISIVYLGKEPRRFSSHYLNEPPPEEALPITPQPGKPDGITLGQPDNAAPAEGDVPAQADASTKTDATTQVDPGAKGEEPAKSSEPKPD